MKQIPVKVPHTDIPVYALVDDEDYGLVSSYKWQLGTGGRAHAWFKGHNRVITMHRLIMGDPEGFEIDHKHHKRLDNRKSQLRKCTRLQNAKNKSMSKNNTTGYKGIYFHGGKWQAKVLSDGNIYYSTSHDSELEAALAYNKLAIKHHKEYACLNTFEDYTGKIADNTLIIDTDAYIKLQNERLTLKSPLMAIATKEIKRAVHAAIKKLTYRENQIICLRYGIADGFIYTLEEIGKIFKLTRQRVQQLEAQAIQKLKMSLNTI